MSFRSKYLLTLLCFSLVPLLFVSYINLRSLHRQGKVYDAKTRSELTEIVHDELLYTVQDYASSLKGGERALWFAISLLKEEVRGALTNDSDTLRAGHEHVYLASDFENKSKAPKDLALVPQLHELNTKDTGNNALASFGHPALLLPPGARADDPRFHDEMLALAGIHRMQHTLFKRLGEDAFRQFICLRDGLSSVYPGHGGFPPDYDCRKQAWYKDTTAASEQTWSGPVTDPVFETPIYFLSIPLLNPKGDMLGVVALDYPLAPILQEKRLSSKWSGAVRSYMVSMTQNPETDKEGLMVFASQDYQTEIPSRKGQARYSWLLSNDAPAYAELMREMATRTSGVKELPLHGEPSLWAYALFGEHEGALHFLVLTLPKSIFMQLPDSFSQQAMELLRNQGFVAFGAMLLAAGLVTIVTILGARSVTRPFTMISEAASRLSQGDFSVRLDLKLKDERQQLVQVINELGPKLSQYMELQRALLVAEEVQKSLLPGKPPEVPGFDISGISIYCDETGGDYFDFLYEQEELRNRFIAVIGDVSGHGIPSALLMATARALLREAMCMPASLAEKMSRVNKMLSQDLDCSGRFMTLFIIELDPETSTLQWVRCGHDPALLFQPDSQDVVELAGQGLPLGVLEDYVYDQYTIMCPIPGSVLVMGTDGIWETMAAGSKGHSEMFGKERLQEVIRKHAHLSALEMQQAVLDAVAAFRGAERQSDDITLTVIKKL